MNRPGLRTAAEAAGILAGSLLVFHLLPLEGGAWPIGAIVGMAVMLGLFPLAVAQARRVMRSAHPWASAVRAVTLLFAVLVLGLAAAHFGLADHNPDQYRGLATRTDALYFSVTVFSTVGFGDITPAGQAARLLITAQMVLDLVFIGVVVRLVTWAASRGPGASPLGSTRPSRDPA